jgi:hypothetical protein
MKKQVAVIFCFGIVCSQLLSQELPRRFCFRSQLEQASGGMALGNLTGQNQFNLASGEPGLPSRRGVRSREDPPIVGDTLRKALISASSPSEENDPELRRIRKQRLISGLGLAASWVGTVVGDLLYEDGYRSTTLIPVVGPWITLVRMASNHDPGWRGAKALLVISGIAQTGLATYFIVSLTRHTRPKETKAVALSVGFNTINLRLQF